MSIFSLVPICYYRKPYNCSYCHSGDTTHQSFILALFFTAFLFQISEPWIGWSSYCISSWWDSVHVVKVHEWDTFRCPEIVLAFCPNTELLLLDIRDNNINLCPEKVSIIGSDTLFRTLRLSISLSMEQVKPVQRITRLEMWKIAPQFYTVFSEGSLFMTSRSK